MEEEREQSPTEGRLGIAIARALHLISEILRLQELGTLFEAGEERGGEELTEEGARLLTELRLITSALTNPEARSKLYSLIGEMQGEMMNSLAAIQYFPTKRWGTRQLNVCQKCGWPWFSKVPNETPPQCPKCRDDYWQRAYIIGPRDKGAENNSDTEGGALQEQ